MVLLVPIFSVHLKLFSRQVKVFDQYLDFLYQNCHDFKFLGKKNLYHPNFYIRIFSGDLEKGLFESNLTLILSEKLNF